MIAWICVDLVYCFDYFNFTLNRMMKKKEGDGDGMIAWAFFLQFLKLQRLIKHACCKITKD